VLTTADPNQLQDAVEQLAEPQYALLETLGEAESVQHHVRREVEVLRTRTEIIDTLYDRRRNLVIGLLGVLLTLGQVLDKDVAKLLYTDFGVGRVWEYLGGMPLSQAQDRVLLYIRLLSIVTLTLLIAALIALWMRLQKWRKARWH
jgi:hypothetical protein